MAWLGESLSSLTGHIQNLTKEVLSESREEPKDADAELTASREKVEELESLCATQDLEISALKKQNAELRRRLGEEGLGQDGPAPAAAPATATWFSVEQRCDAAYVGGRKRAAASAPKEGVLWQSASAEQVQHQLGKLQQEKNELQLAYAALQAQTQQLQGQLAAGVPSAAPAPPPAPFDECLREQLQEAHKRIAELETELQQVQQQWLDHLNDAQMNANELRSDIENTRWQLLHESGTQKAERLRARQDLVNRMIQMGEKNREAELGVKKIQAEDKHLSSEIATIIQKLGDPQHQELIQGTLNALELENQVLNLRNAQLERLTESKKGSLDQSLKEEEGRKSHASDNCLHEKVGDSVATKAEDDSDSLSDILDLSSQKQQLESQVAHLQSEIEIYKRDIKHYDIVRTDWSHEKRDTELQLRKLKEELKECEAALSLVTAQKGLLAVKQNEINLLGNDELEATRQLLKTAQEVEEKLGDDKQQLELEKGFLEAELEAMQRVVQDLEVRVAALDEENASLRGSLEELDTQHQDALDQLLALRRADQAEKEALHCQLQLLKQRPPDEPGPVQVELGVQVEGEANADDSTQTEQLSTVACDSQTDSRGDGDGSKELLAKYNQELHEKICKLTNFEVPNDCQRREGVEAWETIQVIVKLCNEYKWKKDTLERKVGELMKEGREARKSLAALEDECTGLQGSVDRLNAELAALKSEKEHLPTIPENNEEVEALEQRIASLEGELEVMAEVRTNLEADSARMRREHQELAERLRCCEAQARNLENLETEVKQQYEVLQRHETERRDWARAAEESAETAAGLRAEVAKWQAAAQDLQQQKEDAAEQAAACADAAKSEVEALRTQTKALQGERDSLVQKSKAWQGEADGQRREIEMLSSAKVCLENKVEDLIDKLEEAARIHEGKEQALDLSRKLITDLSFKLEEASKHEAELAEKTCEDLRAEMEKWKRLASENEKRFQEAMNRNLQQQEQVSKLIGDVMSRDSEKSELERNLDALRGVNDKQSGAVQALQNKLTLKEAQLQQVVSKMKQRSLADTEAALQTTRQQLKEVQAALDSSHRDRQLAAEENQVLLQQLQREEGKVVELQERIHGLERSLCMDRRSNGTNGTNGREPEDTAKLLEEISQLKLIVKEKDGKINETVEKLKKYRQQGSHTETIKVLHEEVAQLESAWEKSEDYAKDLSNSMMQMDQECEDLRARNSEVEKQWQELLAQHYDLSSEHDRLKRRCEGLEQKEKEVEALREKLQQQPEQMLVAGPKELQHRDDKDSDEVESHKCAGQACGNETVLMSLQKQSKELQGEKQKALGVVEEKNREIELLNTKLMHLNVIIDEHKETIANLDVEKRKQEQREFQLTETTEMMKGSIANLSQLITEKDAALAAATSTESELREALAQALREREQLVTAVHQKHQESVSYHAEIQRLGSVLTREMAAHHQLAEQHAAALRRLEEAPAVGAELETARTALAAREQEMRLRDGELEALRQEVAVLEQRASGHCADAATASQEECAQLAESLKEEQARNKQLLADAEARQAREASMQRETERLRLHLVEIEEMYTQEALLAQQSTQELQGRLAQAEEQLKASSTVHKSASIRANQQVETLQEQARLIAQQRDEVQEKLSAAEDQVHRHAAALRNLQAVLEQFQRDKEREIQAATRVVYAEVEAGLRQQDELRAEVASLKKQLAEAKEGLSAAARLGEQLDLKAGTIAELKKQVSQLEEQFSKAQEEAKTVSLNVEGKVDKSLVKNVVLGYFLAPAKSQPQVLPVVASVLGLSEEERRRLEQRLGFPGAASRPGNAAGGWLSSLLHPAGPGGSPDQSLSEAFVRFLESESRPQPQLRLLPGSGATTNPSQASQLADAASASAAGAPAGGSGGLPRRSPLLLTDVQLPTFAQLPVGRNSSSILKDILKES